MAKDFITEQLKKAFRDRQTFSRDELYDFYSHLEPDLNESTFRWRIYQLKEKNIITPLSKNLFSFDYKPVFKPVIDETERKLFNRVTKQFTTLKPCIWSTKIISEFMLHQPGRFFTMLEVENDALEPVFYFLKDSGARNVYLQPQELELERYVFENETAIILQSLVSKAPVQKIKKINTTTIEKLIVDIFCDKKLFSTFQGTELVNIINNAYLRYAINFTKLFNYAKRRRKEIELMEYLSQQTEIPQYIFND
jgi:hypothetical protein